MTDITPGGFADTPGPEATPEQDADVRALLSFLRDEPLEMPADVRARLDAVIAEERHAAAVAVAGAGTTTSGVDGSDDRVGPVAPVTVLPTQPRGPSTRAFRIVGGLAAAALVVLGGVTVLHGLGGGSSSSSSTASSSAAGGAADATTGTKVTATGTHYSQASLAAQATALVAAARAASPAADRTVAVPSPATESGTTYSAALTPVAADACVRAVTEGDGSTAVAVDSGSYDGQPAVVVVVPPPDAPGSLDVFVVKPGCGAGGADLFEFQRIPAS